MPYHALTQAERETYNARKKLLAHAGDILRNKAVEREKNKNFSDEKVGIRSKYLESNISCLHHLAMLPSIGRLLLLLLRLAPGEVTFLGLA